MMFVASLRGLSRIGAGLMVRHDQTNRPTNGRQGKSAAVGRKEPFASVWVCITTLPPGFFLTIISTPGIGSMAAVATVVDSAKAVHMSAARTKFVFMGPSEGGGTKYVASSVTLRPSAQLS